MCNRVRNERVGNEECQWTRLNREHWWQVNYIGLVGTLYQYKFSTLINKIQG